MAKYQSGDRVLYDGMWWKVIAYSGASKVELEQISPTPGRKGRKRVTVKESAISG